MLAPRRTLLVLVLIAVFAAAEVPVVHGAEAHPAISATQFLFFRPQGQNATIVFPYTFHVQYSSEVDHLVNTRYGDLRDPATFKYEVLRTEWSFETKPQEYVDHPYIGRYLVSYVVSISAVPRATRPWYLFAIDEYVKVYVYAIIYVRIERPPRLATLVQLEEIVGLEKIKIRYSVLVKRVHPEEQTWNVTGTVELLTYPWLAFYELVHEESSVTVKRYGGFGDFDEDGFIAMGPIGDIKIKLCIEKPLYDPFGFPPYELEGYLVYRSELQEVEVPFRLTTEWSPPCGEYTIPNVLLIPGNYTEANPFVVTLKTGMFETSFHIKTEITGLLIAVLNPVVIATAERVSGGFRWIVNAIATVVLYRYKAYYVSGRVSLTGTVWINGTPIQLRCAERVITESGIYRCNATSYSPPYQPGAVYTGTSSLNYTLRVTPAGNTHSDVVNAYVVMVTHASLQYIVHSIIRYTRILVTAILVAWTIYFVLSYLFGIFKGTGGEGIFFFRTDPVNMLIYLILVVTFIHVLPILYHETARLICMFPEYRFRAEIGCPLHLRHLTPEEAVSYLFSYYDRLIINVKQDYVTWVETQIAELESRFRDLLYVIMALLALAVVLMVTMNAHVSGSLIAALFSFITVVLPFIISLAPIIATILVYISLVELILSFIVILMLVGFIVGIFMLAIDSPYTRRFGEVTLGASFFFLLLSPIVAMAVYGMYGYAKYVLEKEFVEEIARRLPVLSIPLARGFVPPLDIVARISGFVALSTISMTIVIFANVFILSRTGIIVSVGEQLARILRR